MQFDIIKLCANSLRSFLQDNFRIQIKSSHAHELVACYFGYSSRAALLADLKYPISNLRQAEIIVLIPTAEINKRREQLKDLPENLPDDIVEGVYFPLYEEKYILNNIWPTFEYLGTALADQELKLKPNFFKDQKIQREGVKVELIEDGVRITVDREYISPSLLLSFQKGTLGICEIFELKRIAGYIGYVKANHYWTEGETLDAAKEKIDDGQYLASNHKHNQEAAKSSGLELNFAEWLARQKKRKSPLGDFAIKRGFSNQNDGWPSYDNLEDYKDHLKLGNPPRGATAALESAWKAYKAFLKRENSPHQNTRVVRPPLIKNDTRKIVFIKNVKPIHYSKRTIESFIAGDKAWISWNGSKAIPVKVLEVDERYYTFRTERPLNNVGEEFYVRLDEVRSTPELACLNCVTM